jgi:hypothetical protein
MLYLSISKQYKIMKKLILFFAIVCLALFGQGIQHLNAQVIMKNSAGETTEITAEAPLLAENGEPIVWITRDYQNNRAVIHITCNQSMSGNTYYRNNLGDVFTLHYSAEPQLNAWEWRDIYGTVLAENPTQTYTTNGSFTGDMSYAQSSSYGSGVAYTYGVYFVLADPSGGGDTEFDATFLVFDLDPTPVQIQGAQVTVDGVGLGTTDVNGMLVFPDLTNGTYDYTITTSGYDERTGSFLVNGDDIDIEINYTEYTVTFTIADNDSWESIEGATISILGHGETTSNLAGMATFDGMYSDTYYYVITAIGYEDYTDNFTINTNDIDVDVLMTPESISYYDANFTILDDNTSLAIENASISIDGVGTETSDVSGQASFIDLVDGTYNYTITADGYELYSSDFTINAGDEAINVNLTPETLLYNANFTVTDLNTSDAIENASISIDGIGTETSDASGQATFNDLEDGTYNYTITADEYELYSSDFTINGGDEAINVQLTPSGVGINDNNLSVVQISPNPAHSQLHIKTNGLTENVIFSIYDVSGKLVKSYQLNCTSSDIDISSFENGMYLYSITNKASEIVTGKFVKN